MTDRHGFRVVATAASEPFGRFSLDRLVIEAPDGSRHERGAVRHPGAVNVVAIDGDERVVMLRQYRAAVDAVVLEIVAGLRDVAGEDPAATARRELAEEAGLAAGRIVKLAEFYNSVGLTDEVSTSFLALDLTELASRDTQDPEEHAMEVLRVPLTDVDAMMASGELRDAKSIIGIELARRYLAGEYRGFGP